MPLLSRRRCPSCGEPADGRSPTCPRCGAALGEKGEPKDRVEQDFDDILRAIIEGPKTPGVKRSEELDDELRDLELGGVPPPRAAPGPQAAKPPPREGQEAVPTQESGPQEDLLTYECLSCGAQVPEDATKCPSCGTAFSGSDQFDCPVCGSPVAFEAVQCPKCGVRFVEDRAAAPYGREPAGTEGGASASPGPAAPLPPVTPEAIVTPKAEPQARPAPPTTEAPTSPPPAAGAPPAAAPAPPPRPPGGPAGQRELAALVAEVKAHVAMGKRYNLAFGNATEAIVRATDLAKRKEFPAAVALLEQAREALLQGYREQAAQRLEAFARASQGLPPLLARIHQAQGSLAAGDLEGALAGAEGVASQLAARDPRALETRGIVEETAALLEQFGALGIDGSAVQEMLQRTQASLARGDIATAHGLALQGRDRALAALRERLAEELKRAKESIFDMKLKGQRLERPMEIIKRASHHFKQGEWAAAARELQALRQELALR